MRIVFFDAIQEAHVAASLERAFVAAGHEVYATGRFGRGVEFADPQRIFRVAGAHLERIRAVRPDWILVFRPASAPPPVLAALRATGAQLATWLSDDPVLYGLSYGSAPEDYDLVLHCGDARVLRFYEERIGRPTGVNLPFWTDHVTFPRVYGSRPAEATAMFLGNLAGPVRRRRYEQLAAMRHDVRVYGAVDEDPAGLSAGFLDTDTEVLAAGARTRLALNIPQFFADHRGSPTWFDGLDELGHFELPSRVIQYAAMGLPVVNIVPGVERLASFPELPVCESIAAADDWIDRALADGALDELSTQVSRRFDAHFAAAARVMAFEALAAGEEDWRRMDAGERALWFTQFDATQASEHPSPVSAPDAAPASPTGGVEPGPAPAGGTSSSRAACAAEPTADNAAPGRAPFDGVAVLHGRAPSRFSGLDVLLRELDGGPGRAAAAVWGPDEVDALTVPASGDWAALVDPERLLPALERAGADVLVLAEGIGVDAAAAARLRSAGVATVLLLRDERLTRAQAEVFDLVACVGPGTLPRAGLLRSLENAVHVPALVESAFLDLVRATPPRPGAAVVGAGTDDDAADLIEWGPTGATDRLDPATLRGADLTELCTALRRETLLLEPVRIRGHRVPSALTGHALCATEAVLAPRWQDLDRPDVFGSWLLRAASAGEARTKLTGATSTEHPAPGADDRAAQVERRRAASDAGTVLPAWFATARARARTRGHVSSQTHRVLVVHGGRHAHADEDRSVVDALHALGHRVLEANVARHPDLVHEVRGARGTALRVDLAPLETMIGRFSPDVVVFAGRRLRPTPECAERLRGRGTVCTALVREPTAAVPNASLGIDAAVCMSDARSPAEVRDRLTAFLATALARSGVPRPDTQPAAPPRTVLVSGYYGEGNVGDELLLRAIVERLTRRHPDAVPVVAAVAPADVERTHGVQAFSRADLHEAEAWAARASGVLLGPGGHWHDYSIDRAGGLAGTFTGTRYSPAHLAQLPLMVRGHGGRVVVHGMGVGPLTDPGARAAVHLTGLQAGAVTVRDAESRRLLTPMSGSWPAEVAVAPDVVYALRLPAPVSPPLPVHEAAADRSTPRAGPTAQTGTWAEAEGWIAVNLRPWDADWPAWQCLETVVEAARRRRLGVWFVAMQNTDEAEAAALQTAAAGRVPTALLPADAPLGHLLHVLGGARTLVSMRLHATLLRHRLRGTAVGLAYDPKVTAHFAELGRSECCLALHDADTTLGPALDAALDAPTLGAAAEARVERLESEAAASLDRALDTLCGGPARRLDPSWRRR